MKRAKVDIGGLTVRIAIITVLIAGLSCSPCWLFSLLSTWVFVSAFTGFFKVLAAVWSFAWPLHSPDGELPAGPIFLATQFHDAFSN